VHLDPHPAFRLVDDEGVAVQLRQVGESIGRMNCHTAVGIVSPPGRESESLRRAGGLDVARSVPV
jgi:hypothetical protein